MYLHIYICIYKYICISENNYAPFINKHMPNGGMPRDHDVFHKTTWRINSSGPAAANPSHSDGPVARRHSSWDGAGYLKTSV